MEKPGNFEQKNIPQKIEEKPNLSRRNFLIRGAAIIAASAPGVDAFANEKTTAASVQIGPEKTSHKNESSPKTYEDLEKTIFSYIKSLGVFAKLALVQEIKKKADLLIAILASEKNVYSPEAEQVVSTSGTEVKTVLTKYIQGVKELPDKEEAQALSEMIKLVETIKVTSINDLRIKFN